jgi:germination protein M
MITLNMARKRHTLGCLFYIALILLALVIFLFNRSRVQEVIEKTGFTRLFERKHVQPVEVVVTPPAPAPARGEAAPPAQAPKAARQAAPADVVVELSKPQPPPRKAAVAGQPAAAGQPAKAEARTRQARLYFIAVRADGRIQLKSVIRPVKYLDAPLTSTLEALLAGPTPAEVSQGLMSLVTPQTRLRRVYVKDGIAYLDFSEAFRFNSLGKEGLAAQLEQVVYSATEFPTVKRVQILLEGKTADYLGPEGIFIGEPLSRDSFAD